MTLETFLGPTSILDWIGLIFVGTFWFAGTVGVLCIMEVRFCLTTEMIKIEFLINRAYRHSYMLSAYTG